MKKQLLLFGLVALLSGCSESMYYVVSRSFSAISFLEFQTRLADAEIAPFGEDSPNSFFLIGNDEIISNYNISTVITTTQAERSTEENMVICLNRLFISAEGSYQNTNIHFTFSTNILQVIDNQNIEVTLSTYENDKFSVNYNGVFLFNISTTLDEQTINNLIDENRQNIKCISIGNQR